MFCTDDYSIELFQSLSYLVFSPQAPSLLYYSHVPAAIIAVLLSLFIISKNRQSLAAKILVTISLLYAAWAVMNVFIWTQIDVRVVMYLWSFWFTIFTLIFTLSFYFLYAFIKKTDVSFGTKLLFVILILPIVLLSFTSYNLSYFDIAGCNALENPLMIGYAYLLTTSIFISMVIFAFNQYYKAEASDKKQVSLVSWGTLLFLISFAVATYIPSIFNLFESTVDTFAAEMYGFFGMTIFIGFLAYLIVKFKAFNIKLLGAQALVLTVISLIGAQFFFIQNPTNKILNSITLGFSIIFGYLLVKSVKIEVKQKEELAEANAGQENLIHIMNHQIKGYIAKGRNIFAELISEPEYGLTSNAKPMVDEGLKSLTEGVEFIQQVLNGSSAATGKITYNMKPIDFRTLVAGEADKQSALAREKGLTLTLNAEDGIFNMNADEIQAKEMVKNLINNSINYTQAGSISINLKRVAGKALLSIADTGVGISKEDMAKLFQKGARGKDSLKYNVNSTGYGLAFVKAVAEAHKGRVWVESKGQSLGSTFYLELPLS